ncbi:MAG: hypothetical protein CM1200mP41_03880 [Gammaproteobacteria bacterium]|nr:MAG: hypothetical protein CM1200mP41_03880 [Gammaproteobacteria bacterium]
MSETTKKQRLGAYDQAVEHWEKTYAQNLANERPVYNRSGIEIDPLYLPDTDPPLDYVDRLGLPGQPLIPGASTPRCTGAAPGASGN